MYVLGRGGGGWMNRDLRSDQLTSPPPQFQEERITHPFWTNKYGGGRGHIQNSTYVGIKSKYLHTTNRIKEKFKSLIKSKSKCSPTAHCIVEDPQKFAKMFPVCKKASTSFWWAKPFLERKSLIFSLQKNINRIRGKGQKAYEYLADRFKQLHY